MFKPLVRLTLVAVIWRRYKRNIVFSLAALGLIILVSLVHSDYLNYLQQSQQPALIGWSFVIKWALYALIVLIWLLGLKLPRSASTKSNSPASGTSNSRGESEQDPFKNIRGKRQLKGRGDQVIQQKR